MAVCGTCGSEPENCRCPQTATQSTSSFQTSWQPPPPPPQTHFPPHEQSHPHEQHHAHIPPPQMQFNPHSYGQSSAGNPGSWQPTHHYPPGQQQMYSYAPGYYQMPQPSAPPPQFYDSTYNTLNTRKTPNNVSLSPRGTKRKNPAEGT